MATDDSNELIMYDVDNVWRCRVGHTYSIMFQRECPKCGCLMTGVVGQYLGEIFCEVCEPRKSLL
jgi:uncharacterized Zn finger protein (UPF0148 family)